MKVGYYLKANYENSNKVNFLGKDPILAADNLNIALVSIVDLYQIDYNDIDWWIDYCYGLDVDGNPAWCNIDQTDSLEKYF